MGSITYNIHIHLQELHKIAYGCSRSLITIIKICSFFLWLVETNYLLEEPVQILNNNEPFTIH